MGLGKTLVCLALIVANPPPLENQVLPLECRNFFTTTYPDYTAPPTVDSALVSNRGLLSNGSLVIAPMTLCSQWQAEIERFAPWMNVLTLHSGDVSTLEEVAVADVVVASTFVLQGQHHKTQRVLSQLLKVHFHRIFVDESHYNQSGEKIKRSLSMLSATHRYCVTGTPVGHSLDDLAGQVSLFMSSCAVHSFAAYASNFIDSVRHAAPLPPTPSIYPEKLLEECS